MNDSYTWWLFFVGLALGIAGTWLLIGRLRRTDDDEAAVERAAEARWISRAIGGWGGDVPVEVVDQVLDLHRRYLGGEVASLAPAVAAAPGGPAGSGRAASARARDDTAMEGHDTGREASEADVDEAR